MWLCVCALTRYVVQQAALCSQLSSAVSMSLITHSTQRRKREGHAGVVICTRHLGEDVEERNEGATRERAERGDLSR